MPRLKRNSIVISELFEEWMKYRKRIKTTNNTMLRDRQRWNRYCSKTPFVQKKLYELKRPDWKAFCCHIISGQTYDGAPLTHNEWGSTKAILNGMLSYAQDKGWVEYNCLIGMKFEKHLFRQNTVKTAKSETFSKNEQKKLCKWCYAKFDETNNPAYLYPPLNLLLGARVGEIAALKWSCLGTNRRKNFLCITESEHHDVTRHKTVVSPYTKTHKARVVPINNEAIAILDKIRDAGHSSIWIFAKDNERLTVRQLSYILVKYSKETGAVKKSTHKLRKTYGSNLYNAGATVKQCSDILGNTPEVFTKCYLYNTATDNQMLKLVSKVSLPTT